jgi:hypothetical protein
VVVVEAAAAQVVPAVYLLVFLLTISFCHFDQVAQQPLAPPQQVQVLVDQL